MSEPIVVEGVAAVLQVSDVEQTVAFYCRHLGSTRIKVLKGEYGIVALQGHHIHFIKAASEDAVEATARYGSIRIRTKDVDACWKQIQATNPPTSVKPPVKKPWGRCEFHVMDPDGILIVVGDGH